ncbi:hypothetical protein F5Y19DRAFT_92623 [Xylariaceae sp. FL1651]|nr:hypothetical protein F5Y19DRAFT_92623 [Xylariaceae sp. FL1651]
MYMSLSISLARSMRKNLYFKITTCISVFCATELPSRRLELTPGRGEAGRGEQEKENTRNLKSQCQSQIGPIYLLICWTLFFRFGRLPAYTHAHTRTRTRCFLSSPISLHTRCSEYTPWHLCTSKVLRAYIETMSTQRISALPCCELPTSVHSSRVDPARVASKPGRGLPVGPHSMHPDDGSQHEL